MLMVDYWGALYIDGTPFFVTQKSNKFSGLSVPFFLPKNREVTLAFVEISTSVI